MGYKEMGYKSNETSIQIWKMKTGLRINNINVSTSLYDGSCSFISEEECKVGLNSITPSNEYEKIWNKFDYQAVKNVCEKVTINGSGDEFHIIIKSCEEFEKALKEIGIYEAYLKEKELLDEKRKFLESENLIEVKFRNYQSWETGVCFLILNERVEKNLFTRLIKSGLYYHQVDEDNEERFVEWCIRDNEMNRLKLAENSIRVTK